MSQLKIAVMLGNLRMDRYEGMKKVVEMGVPGIHITAGGDWDARTMTSEARKELVAHVKGLGLAISAISCWGGQVDLTKEENWQENVDWGKKNLELAADLECGIWQGHCGVMPEDPKEIGWQRMVDGMGQMAARGEEVGACLAIETGPEPPYVLRRLITEIGSSAIRINWDPANMILWGARFCELAGEPYNREKWIERFQPNEGARALADVIVHTHAKDALVHEDGKRQEVPLGTGWVDWPRYVGYLREAGFNGYFAIERETGENPVGDIQKAVDFLRTL
jgi:sugar phosphate isomerase/epimerase